ncbi:MAG: FliA/WhiG family RNA polymerase sigma factor [Candidatus Hydrogenedentota bacterium]
MNAQDHEKKLWERWKKSGDEDARQELIVHHMRVVRYIAGRMAIHVPSSVDLDDLIGWGALGLLDAIEKFDYTQDIKFSTYASIRVRGAIIDQIRSLDWAPRSLRIMARKIGTAKEKLRHKQGREPSFEDVGGELGIDADQVEDVQMQLQTAQILSLDDYLPTEEGSNTRKVDVTSDADMPTPESVALDHERQQVLVEAILALPEQMQKVLNLYYYEELTLKEIGAVLEVSESRVCQIHSAAMKRLRKIVRQREVEDASTSRSTNGDGSRRSG